MLICMMLCVLCLGGWAKDICLLPFQKKKTFLYDIFTVPDMSAGEALMWSFDM